LEQPKAKRRGPAVLDAPGADGEINCLTHGDFSPAQRTEIAGGFDNDRAPGHGYDFEAAQKRLDFTRRALVL
jgi:hypothetical protein